MGGFRSPRSPSSPPRPKINPPEGAVPASSRFGPLPSSPDDRSPALFPSALRRWRSARIRGDGHGDRRCSARASVSRHGLEVSPRRRVAGCAPARQGRHEFRLRRARLRRRALARRPGSPRLGGRTAVRFRPSSGPSIGEPTPNTAALRRQAPASSATGTVWRVEITRDQRRTILRLAGQPNSS